MDYSLGGTACPPLSPTDVIYSLQTSDGQVCKPEIFGRIDKGFFMVDNNWTCYCRNYFSLHCSFALTPTVPSRETTVCLVQHGGAGQQVHRFAMSIAAVVDGKDCNDVAVIADGNNCNEMEATINEKSDNDTATIIEGKYRNDSSAIVDENDGNDIAGFVNLRDPKSIELVQHPSKGDKVHPGKPALITLSPRPAVSYGMHGINGRESLYDQGSFNPDPKVPATEATFERVQFKNATANNGKRRTAQQYNHLSVELFADVGPQHTSQ